MRRPVPRERVEGRADASGLTAAEAARRLAVYGSNAIAESAPSGLRQLAADTVKDPMLWFLLVTAGLFVAIGDGREAIVLVLAIIPLTGMDVFLHWRTAASTKSLHSRLAPTAVVLRDGRPTRVAAAELVPGDVVVVRAGEYFPADGIVRSTREAQVDESPLTGESLPVAKLPLPTLPPGRAPLVESEHWGFAGSKVLTGETTSTVVFTGAETLYGEIIGSVVASRHERTPLQRSIGRLVERLLLVAVVFCVVLAVTRLLQGRGLVDALLSAATLAVAAIPEEFPVVFSFFLGVGVYRMARRKALVRRAVSVENIGRVTCICSDKTGTLTEGQLRLAHLIPASGCSEEELRRTAIAASRHESLDPIDQVILEGVPDAPAARGRLAVFPFTEARRREAAVVKGTQNTVLVAVKGAPEVVLKLAGITGGDLVRYRHEVDRLAREGHKLIACASLAMPEASWKGEEPDEGYRLVGLLAFEDPVRPAVPAAVAACKRAGIHVLMVTGDHPETAGAIAREIGLGAAAPRVYSGEDASFASKTGEFFRSIDVVARALPAQKLAIVQALKAQGELVAVTGDGINDVPALQAADIGIAMGARGTRSAREAAAIVLSDDNFASVVAAIAEGRQLLDNLSRSFQYLLMVHIPFVSTAALLPLWGYPLLYLPIHIVWLELVIHPTALLAFQDVAASTLGPRRETTGAALLSPAQWRVTIAVGLLTAVAVGGHYALEATSAGGDARARTLAIMLLLLAGAFAAAGLNGLRTAGARLVLAGTLASGLVLTEVPLFARTFHLTPLGMRQWLLLAGVAALVALVPFALSAALARRRAQGPSRAEGDARVDGERSVSAL
jgi:Ca2+-transporting ATPase